MSELERRLVAEALYWKSSGELVEISEVKEFCVTLDIEFDEFDVDEILMFLADKQ